MALEQIVKKNVPFAAEFDRKGFDNTGRAWLPIELVETLKDRQQVASNSRISFYYRLYPEGGLPYIELTDYFQDPFIDFSKYTQTFQL